jgi:alpha-galactosidase
MRSLRNIPVLVGIARDMEAVCPDAWMLNLTNPMTTICRAVTRESSIRTVGLCHEVTIAGWMIGGACGVSGEAIGMTVTGVNHLPWITELTIEREDGFARLRDALATREEAAFYPKENALKLAMLDRFGALPGAGDRHLVEFFPGFLTEASGQGDRWGVKLTTIAQRERSEEQYVADLEAKLAKLPAELPIEQGLHLRHEEQGRRPGRQLWRRLDFRY